MRELPHEPYTCDDVRAPILFARTIKIQPHCCMRSRRTCSLACKSSSHIEVKCYENIQSIKMTQTNKISQSNTDWRIRIEMKSVGQWKVFLSPDLSLFRSPRVYFNLTKSVRLGNSHNFNFSIILIL